MSEGLLNGSGGKEMKLKLTTSETNSTLVSPTTPPSELHYPLVEANENGEWEGRPAAVFIGLFTMGFWHLVTGSPMVMKIRYHNEICIAVVVVVFAVL